MESNSIVNEDQYIKEEDDYIKAIEPEYPVIKIDEPEYCELKVHYEADPSVVKDKAEEAVAALRNVKIPGFRKGKAPDQAIKIRLRPQINQFIAREMVVHAIDEIVFETNIKILGEPKFSDVKIKDNTFSCNIEMIKKPEFEVNEFKFEIPKPHQAQTVDELVERALLNIRVRLGEKIPYEENDVVEFGDEITMSFYAIAKDGDKEDILEGYTAEGELYRVGTDRWNGWDDNLLGMKAEESREFDFTFDTGPEEILGKTIRFVVTIHSGMKTKPHPVNEKFYELVGVSNIEELMNKLKAISELRLDRDEKERIKKQVAIRLLENNKFDVPKSLVEPEARSICSRMGIDMDMLLEDDRSKLFEDAENNIRLTLILDTIRKTEPDSVLNDNEAQSHLVKHVSSLGYDPNAFFNSPENRQQVMSLLYNIKDEFTLQWVASQATIVE